MVPQDDEEWAQSALQGTLLNSVSEFERPLPNARRTSQIPSAIE